MERKVLYGVFLLVLPFSCFGAGLHGIVKRGADADHSWGYEEQDGPHTWASHFSQCAGKRQSPINIDTNEVDLNEDLGDFEFENFEMDFKKATIENNGHTIQMKPNAGEAPRTMTARGGLDDEYQFLQLHFHWGSDDKRGSEHLINNKAFPLELHLVFMNTNYKSIEDAKQKEDGLAVLGVLFKVSGEDEDNEDFEKIIKELEGLKTEKSQDDVSGFNLRELLPDHTMPYYRYKGSLTTPPCLEIVTWTIFKEFQEISSRQLKMFREITENDKGESAEKLVNNFRPPQPLNRRVVEISGTSNAGSSLIPSVLTAIFTALSFVL